MSSVFYLEDDEALAFVTKRAMERRGYHVVLTNTVEEARHTISRTPCDYALLDLKIGNQSSLALIKEIKACCDIPIVILTGYGSIRTAVHAMKLGAVNFLSKPASVDEIIAAMEDREIEQPQAPVEELPSLKNLEWEAIQKALDENDGNITATARQLKMHRRTLQRKLQKRQTSVDTDDY